MHDLNGGILLNGLFWTVELPKSSFSFRTNRRQAVLHAKDVPLTDSFAFAGPNVVPATASFSVRWEAVGPPEELGSGGGVPATDPAAFLGLLAPARAVGSFSGSELGFSFASNPGASSDLGYAELGTERNGVFL